MAQQPSNEMRHSIGGLNEKQWYIKYQKITYRNVSLEYLYKYEVEMLMTTRSKTMHMT